MVLYIIGRINSGDSMRKIVIEITNESLNIKYRTNQPIPDNLVNTNVINNNELVFSTDYINDNNKIVGLFINDIAKDKDIKTINISQNEIAEIIIPLLKRIDNIEKIYLKEETNFSYSLCESLANNKSIKEINCYTIPTFMMEILDKKGIKVISRSEVLFTSEFMQENNLTSYSKIYYKSSIRISNILKNDDIEDINSFLSINKYLRTIHLEKGNIPDIEKICELLYANRRKNINIEIHDDINDIDVVDKLKALNKKYKSKYKVKLSLVYSKDYLEKNYLKQVIFTTLKLCSIIIFLIIGAIFSYILYDNYQSELKVKAITDEIAELLVEDVEQTPGDKKEETPAEETQNTQPEEDPVVSYQKLLGKNSDTVGWLTVPGTKIDYPVLKGTDNSYYLQRNFNRAKDSNGWIFMDYRNGDQELDSNTIIYGHNRYYSGVMFGTLNNVTKKRWLNNESNHYITFNTMYQSMTWKVFSIYSIDVTSDYLYINFENDETYQNFINLIKGRSNYQFNTEVTTKDKILTLSTCLDNDKRLVVHAVLINSNENAEDANKIQSYVGS